jgi:DNA-binding response OmpR family regulator
MDPSSVLFVDDSELARVAAQRKLSELGIDVITLGSSREATSIDATRFAAALLDIDLGDGWGTDVAQKLRDLAPGLPIAFLTGGTSPQQVDVAQSLGPVFSKSEDPEAAFSWIASVVAAAATG